MISIVNKYKHTKTSSDIYIGRGSPLGNPFSHVPSGKASQRVSTREEAIALYSEWLNENKEKPSVREELNRIKELYRKTGKVYLVCFCSPKPCHGEVIKKLLVSELGIEKQPDPFFE